VLITAFSLGLAATITGLGLVIVHGKRAAAGARLRVPSRAVALLPALSTLVILGLGIVLTAQAMPDVV